MEDVSVRAGERGVARVKGLSILYELTAFAVAALLSSFGTESGVSPLGQAAVAAALMARRFSISVVLGAAVGAALFGRWASLCITCVYVILYLLWRLVRNDVKKLDRLLLLPTAHLLMLPLFYMKTLDATMMGLLNAGISTVAATVMYRSVQAVDTARRSRMLGDAEQLCICLTAAMFLTAVGDFTVYGVSPAAILAGALTLYAVSVKGTGAVAAAVTFAAARVVTGGASMLFIANMAACALAAAMLRRAGKWGIAAGFAACAALIMRFVTGTAALNYIEAGVALLFFCACPPVALSRLGAYTIPCEHVEINRRVTRMQERMIAASSVLEQVSKLFVPGEEEDPRVADGLMFTNRQLSAVSGVLRDIAEMDDGAVRRAFNVNVGASACVKAGSEETGDSMGMREVGGKVLLVLSDGMGSGELAHRESAQAVALLGDLMSVGFCLEDALVCVNRLLILRGEEDMYATLDAMLMDPVDGSAQFIKYGAPPSFVLREGAVHTLSGEALPVGIVSEAFPAVNTVSLKRGDAVVLMTDGVTDALSSDLFDTILTGVGAANTCDDAAAAVLAAAKERSSADDMSVIVARIE